MRALLASLMLFGGVVGCGGEESSDPCQQEKPLDKPQLCLDRESLGFGLEFDEGTYVGQQVQESLILRNAGSQTLHIEDVVQQGDGAFKVEGPVETEVQGLKSTFIRIIFAPTQAREYTGTLTVTSDAENAPEKAIQLSGLGVAPPTP